METLFKKILKYTYLFLGLRTWQNTEYFDPSWTNRIREMAKYISPGKSILDLGCGKMWLKQYLDNNTYYPVDYADRGNGTFVCDFNKNEFPNQDADVAFVSGTMEYVSDSNWFISRISNNCNECVISYCTLEDYPELRFRRRQAWMNDYCRGDIIQMFSNVGFKLVEENTKIPKNRIFYFVKS